MGQATNSPAEQPDFSDPGDDTQRRFRYQASYAAQVSLELLVEQSSFEFAEIFCEHHEDTLIKRNDGKFIGVQVKTRAPGLDLFKAHDPQILHSIVRFIALEIEFPDYFCKFVIATNYSFWRDGKNKHNLQHLLETNKDASADARDLRLLEQYVNKIVAKAKEDVKLKDKAVSSDIVRKVLSIVVLEDNLPKFEDFEVRIALRIGEIYDDSMCDYTTLIKAAKHLVNRMFEAGSRQHSSPCRSYFALHDDPTQLAHDEIISGKRICKVDVETILNDTIRPSVVLATSGVIDLRDLPKGMDRMKLKMAKGGIPAKSISLAEQQKFATEYLVTQWFHKYGADGSGKRYGQVRLIASTVCQEEYDKCYVDNAIFGRDMLINVRERLQQRHKEQMFSGRGLFYNCEYEHLLGIVGMLTEECEVWWSEEFDIPNESA